MRLRPLLLALLFTACGPGAPDLAPAIETTSAGLGTYSELTGFGNNPGALKGYTYVPENMPANAPLVLAFHACSQTAADYQKAGWNQLADRLKFYVLYPEQQPANNAARCFNWAGEFGVPTNLSRGQGENQSIIQMINKMKMDHSIDASRVYASGHSGGAAQVALMLATWPDVFAAGATIAGIPYHCTINFSEVTTCLSPGIDRTPAAWGDFVRAAFTNPGANPRVTIWQGSSDTTVVPRNQTELLEQWTNVHGIDATADSTDMLDGATRNSYKDAGGVTKVETITIPNMGHGTPVDPSNGCGQAGAYFLDVHICSTQRIAEFFGLDGMTPVDTTDPLVNITAPANNMNVSGTVNITVNATDNIGVTAVELFVNGTLLQNDTTAPFGASWDTSGLPNGDYALRAVAHDAAGNTAEDNDTTVHITTGPMDTTPPTVNITSPASGATVSGTIQIQVTATDNGSVAKVEYLVDGTKVGESLTAPYTFAWNTSGVSAGSHALGARATDAAGNQATDSDTSVTVMAGPTDTTPPTVDITAPANGTNVSGMVQIQASASDNVSVAKVEFMVDGSKIGESTSAPYSVMWDASGATAGAHALSARAIDLAGNQATDADTSVTVGGAADTTPPTCTITFPGAGETLKGIVTLKADASDNVRVGRVIMFMDDMPIGTDFTAPYEFLWDTSVFPEGSHELLARAFDAAGNLGPSMPVTITVSHEAEPSPSPSKVFAGQRHWGCSALGAAADPLLLVALGLFGRLWLRRRRGVVVGLCAVGIMGALVGCGADDAFVDGNDMTMQGAYSSPSRILAYLDGKTMVMEGDAIPTHPNGFSQDTNFGSATQCYKKVTMKDQANRIQVVSQLGTLKDAPTTGTTGTCDRQSLASELTFDSTAVLIENVKGNGTCFDFTITYSAFGQEGRGKISEDGKTLVLELFFKDQATGHRCAAGDPGAATVTLSQQPFTGNALQTYSITQ